MEGKSRENPGTPGRNDLHGIQLAPMGCQQMCHLLYGIVVHLDVEDGPGKLWAIPLWLDGTNFKENPSPKWMMAGGTPIFGHLHIENYKTIPYKRRF